MPDIILCIAGIVLQCIFIAKEHKEKYGAAVALKGSASLMFVILGLHGMLVTGGSSFAVMIFIGLIFGCIGDILLNLRFVMGENGQKCFLAGIAAFLVGHIMYLAAMVPMSPSPWLIASGGAAAAAVLLWWILSTVTAKKAFKIFGVFYIGAVVIMMTYAVTNSFVMPSVGTVMCAVGAVLFTVSDIILIFNTFTGSTKFSMRIANLMLYYFGQLLIALCIQVI